MEPYSIRVANPSEQRELTRLFVRATLHAGFNDAFVDRAMPSLTITVPLIGAGAVQVAEQESGCVIGGAAVTPTALRGMALLHSIFVDPAFWRRGVGKVLFGAAIARARVIGAGALMIYAVPSAEAFYKRMGAIRIGESPFALSPDITMPHLIYVVPHDDQPAGDRIDSRGTDVIKQASRGTREIVQNQGL
jgi:GNAT superfamily N-acetyltransferase